MEKQEKKIFHKINQKNVEDFAIVNITRITAVHEQNIFFHQYLLQNKMQNIPKLNFEEIFYA